MRYPTLCGAALDVSFGGERHRIFQGSAYSRATGRCHPPFPEGTSFVPSVCWIAMDPGITTHLCHLCELMGTTCAKVCNPAVGATGGPSGRQPGAIYQLQGRGGHPLTVSQFTKDHLKSIISQPPDWLGKDTTQMILGILAHHQRVSSSPVRADEM